MPMPKKLTADQERVLRERSLLYFRLRLEAAKHSAVQLARELGVSRSTVNAYLNRKAV